MTSTPKCSNVSEGSFSLDSKTSNSDTLALKYFLDCDPASFKSVQDIGNFQDQVRKSFSNQKKSLHRRNETIKSYKATIDELQVKIQVMDEEFQFQLAAMEENWEAKVSQVEISNSKNTSDIVTQLNKSNDEVLYTTSNNNALQMRVDDLMKLNATLRKEIEDLRAKSTKDSPERTRKLPKRNHPEVHLVPAPIEANVIIVDPAPAADFHNTEAPQENAVEMDDVSNPSFQGKNFDNHIISDINMTTSVLPLTIPSDANMPMTSTVSNVNNLEKNNVSNINSGFSLAKKPIGRIPMIYIKNFTGKWSELTINLKQLVPDFTAKSTGKFAYQITVKDETAYRKIATFLREKNIEHVAFNLSKEDQIRVVIKGIPEDVDIDVIESELLSHNYEIRKVKRLPTAKNSMLCPLILVHLPNNQVSKGIHDLRCLCDLYVRVSKYEKRNKVLQCYNCQGFGHGSNSCNLTPKCVKCGLGHPSRNCPNGKTTKPRCANCGNSHTANARICPKYPKESEGGKVILFNEPRFIHNPKPVPSINKNVHKPNTATPVGKNLVRNPSYSEVLKNQGKAQMMANIDDLMNSFMSNFKNIMLSNVNHG